MLVVADDAPCPVKQGEVFSEVEQDAALDGACEPVLEGRQRLEWDGEVEQVAALGLDVSCLQQIAPGLQPILNAGVFRLFRCLRHPCPDRVQTDIGHAGEQGFVRFEGLRGKAGFPCGLWPCRHTSPVAQPANPLCISISSRNV